MEVGKMKTIGLIGGMSWESTVTYYQLLNEAAKERLGGLHSASILLYSFDFAEIEALQSAGNWDACARLLLTAAQKLEAAGADLLLICTNTQHKVADQVQAGVNIPVLHIADAAAEALLARGIKKAALLGTKYTMTQAFFRDRLERAGVETLVPAPEEIERINHIIFDQLCLGILDQDSRARIKRVIDSLSAEGAQGVILGCTELGLLIGPEDSALPLFDTTRIHAAKAAEWAMG